MKHSIFVYNQQLNKLKLKCIFWLSNRYDDAIGKDKMIGEVIIATDQIFRANGNMPETWMPISYKGTFSSTNKSAGQILIKVEPMVQMQGGYPGGYPGGPGGFPGGPRGYPGGPGGYPH